MPVFCISASSPELYLLNWTTMLSFASFHSSEPFFAPSSFFLSPSSVACSSRMELSCFLTASSADFTVFS